MISATGDWTNETLEVEYPAVRALYTLAGAAGPRACRPVHGRAQLQQGQPRGHVRLDGALAEGSAVGGPDSRSRRSRPDPLPALLVFHRPPAARSRGNGRSADACVDRRRRGGNWRRRPCPCGPPRSGMRSGSRTTSRRRRPPRRPTAARSCSSPETPPDVEAALRQGRTTPYGAISSHAVRSRPPPTRSGTSTPTTGPPPASASPTSSRRFVPSQARCSWRPETTRWPARWRRPSRRRDSPYLTSRASTPAATRLPRAPLHSGSSQGWRRADGFGDCARPARDPQRRSAIRGLRRDECSRHDWRRPTLPCW